MISRTFRFAPVLAIQLTFPLLHADVTLRYNTEVSLNPALPAPMATAMKGTSAVPQETVIRLKTGKGFYTAAPYDSIIDFTTKEVTFIDVAGKRYAKLMSDRLSQELAGAMPTIPAEAKAAMGAMKTTVTPPRLTGRTAVIQGVETEEHEIVVSTEGPPIPNMPPGPMMRMVLQLWTARSGEVLRVPAIRELTGYSLWSWATLNPTAGMETMMKQLPGFSGTFESLQAIQKGTTMLRMHIDMFMPSMPGVDPNSPVMQMNQEAVELSSAPVLDSVFQIPEGYQQAVASDLIKDLFAKH